MGFAYPGDLIGLGTQRALMNAQAIKPTRLRCLPIATLHHSAARDPTLGFKLYEALARELAAARDLMLTTGQRSATERVVSFLLAFSRRNERNGQDPSDFELPMTRADIGDFLGLTLETVSRAFTKLKILASSSCRTAIASSLSISMSSRALLTAKITKSWGTSHAKRRMGLRERCGVSRHVPAAYTQMLSAT